MIEFIREYWLLLLIPIPLLYALSLKLCYWLGMNAGLRRAHEIMDEVHRGRD